MCSLSCKQRSSGFFPLQWLQPAAWTQSSIPRAGGRRAASSPSLAGDGFLQPAHPWLLSPARRAGCDDTVTTSTGALTCLWHLPKRINQSHSAAALEESPPCSLPGSVGLQTEGTVWVICWCQMCSLSISQYQISIWNNCLAAMGMVLSGSVWQEQRKPWETVALWKEETLLMQGQNYRVPLYLNPTVTAFPALAPWQQGSQKPTCPALWGAPCSKGKRHTVLSVSTACTGALQEKHLWSKKEAE